jgi:predicted CXXCH cytochrome family protein
VLLVAVLAAAGCTETEFIEREVFNPPPDSVHGFLGYFNASDKLTACGNCHIGVQSEWENTVHADAYATLDNNPGAQPFCYTCHTVSENGNPVAEPAGWSVAEDPAYHDVQCESCHGPGLEHVQNPDASQPLVSLAVTIPLEDATNGCAECHSGTHHPFAEEWSQSGHATLHPSASTNPSCQPCHSGQGALRSWGVNVDYLEKNEASIPITCAVCHDPHDATNRGQLRLPVVASTVEEHLCSQCHNRRTVPDPNSSHGLAPHAPEAALLSGDAGWFPPGAIINEGQIVGSHGSEGNPTLCATCHVNQFEVVDPESGDHVFTVTGHLFTALPCVDAQGIPQIGTCEITTTARSFNGCTSSGCHATAQTAFSALTTALLEIQDRAADLLDVLIQVDPNLDGAGGEIDGAAQPFTVAEGAFFNLNLANFGAAEHSDPPTAETILGGAAHNPFLIRALLLASLQAVQDTYSVTPSGAHGYVDWNAELEALMGRLPQ